MRAATTTFREERDEEDLVVEEPVEHGPQATEERVERRDDRDGQVGLKGDGDGGLEHEPRHDSEDQSDDCDHSVLSCPASELSAPVGPVDDAGLSVSPVDAPSCPVGASGSSHVAAVESTACA